MIRPLVTWIAIVSTLAATAGPASANGRPAGGSVSRPAFHAAATAPHFSPGNHVVQSQPQVRNFVPNGNSGAVLHKGVVPSQAGAIRGTKPGAVRDLVGQRPLNGSSG